jgi:hypothetical protein
VRPVIGSVHQQRLERARDRVRGESSLDSQVISIVDEGLGNSAYLVDMGDGRALAVDPSRDLRALDAAAASCGLRVVAAADTHLHADFLSGATRLAARDGAAVYASAAGGRKFPHKGLADGDEVDLGGPTLQAWATPGHTGEHVAFCLLNGEHVIGVFTGRHSASATVRTASNSRRSSMPPRPSVPSTFCAPDSSQTSKCPGATRPSEAILRRGSER